VPLIVGEKQKQGEARRKERIEAAGARIAISAWPGGVAGSSKEHGKAEDAEGEEQAQD
jgi:hypothetical protein